VSAKQYALQRLEDELAATLTYHSVAHTRDRVVPAAERIAQLEGIRAPEALLVSTAAWFHDLGYIERHEDNEIVGVRIAQKILPKFKYSVEQIRVISNIIMATRLPQTPHNLLESIMADADFESFGSEDFLEQMAAIRNEFEANGSRYDDVGWYTYQLEFLQKHQYFTASARRLYDPQKQINTATIELFLAEAGEHVRNPDVSMSDANNHKDR
jgi:uncharacterized protein